MYKYSLYYNKSTYSMGILPIRKMQRLMARVPETAEIVEYGDNHYLSSNAELLRKMAEVIKTEWVEDLEKKIQEVKKIKV